MAALHMEPGTHYDIWVVVASEAVAVVAATAALWMDSAPYHTTALAECGTGPSLGRRGRISKPHLEKQP